VFPRRWNTGTSSCNNFVFLTSASNTMCTTKLPSQHFCCTVLICFICFYRIALPVQLAWPYLLLSWAVDISLEELRDDLRCQTCSHLYYNPSVYIWKWPNCVYVISMNCTLAGRAPLPWHYILLLIIVTARFSHTVPTVRQNNFKFFEQLHRLYSFLYPKYKIWQAIRKNICTIFAGTLDSYLVVRLACCSLNPVS